MIQIPDILKYDKNKKDEPTRLMILMDEYEEKFGGDSWSTEGIDFSDEQLERVFEKCLQENRMFYDVIGIDLSMNYPRAKRKRRIM